MIADLASTVGILYDGELIAEGSPDDLTDRMASGEEETLEDVFLEVTTDHGYDARE